MGGMDMGVQGRDRKRGRATQQVDRLRQVTSEHAFDSGPLPTPTHSYFNPAAFQSGSSGAAARTAGMGSEGSACGGVRLLLRCQRPKVLCVRAPLIWGRSSTFPSPPFPSPLPQQATLHSLPPPPPFEPGPCA